MNAEKWFDDQLTQLANDPDFLTEELLLDITEQFAVRMQEEGLRPVDLAQRLDVSRAFISQLLNGRPNMTVRTLVSVAHALGTRVQVQLREPNASTRRLRAYTRPFSSHSLEQASDSAAAA